MADRVWPPGKKRLPVDVGDRVDAGPAEYKFGADPLSLRVSRVGDLVRFDGEVWVELFGYEIFGDGSVDPQERVALVRRSALGRSR